MSELKQMDKLELLFEKQKELMDFYHAHRDWYKKSSLNDKLFIFAFALLFESVEFIAGLNWKPWKNKTSLDIDYLKEELIDLLHFWLTLAIYMGIQPEEVVEEYIKKNKENFRRQKEDKEYKVAKYESNSFDSTQTDFHLERNINKTQNPLETQIGGDHYKKFKIQPVEFIVKNKLGYIEGCIVKYICRHRHKGGKEDLLKARHYIDLLIQLEYGGENG